MKVVLLNEFSQAEKNPIIFNELTNGLAGKDFEVTNLGMFGKDDRPELTYIHLGLMSALLINGKAADFIVTGCGTGQGAMISLNNYPGICCGLIVDPTDAFLFSQINNGNAVSIPYAKGFGWGAELNLRNIIEQLFKYPAGQGYPPERKEPQQRNVQILNETKQVINKDIYTIVAEIELELLQHVMSCKAFREYFTSQSQDQQLVEAVLSRIS